VLYRRPRFEALPAIAWQSGWLAIVQSFLRPSMGVTFRKVAKEEASF
jgi:hypothetical protein